MAGSAPYAPAGSAGPQVTTHTAARPGVGSKASRTGSVTSSRSPGRHRRRTAIHPPARAAD